MAPPKKKPRGSQKGLKPFPKGTSGNPKGSSQRSRDLAKLKTLRPAELASIGSELLRGSRKELSAVGKDTDASVAKLALATLLVRAIKEADARTLDVVLSRVVGRPKETIELSGVDGGAVEVASRTMTIEELTERADALALRRAEIGED